MTRLADEFLKVGKLEWAVKWGFVKYNDGTGQFVDGPFAASIARHQRRKLFGWFELGIC